MAKTVHNPVVQETIDQTYRDERDRPTSLRFRCEGLREDGDGGFVLEGVTLKDVDYAPITAVLKESGLPNMEAEILTEEFATMVQGKLIAKALSDRMREVRIG